MTKNKNEDEDEDDKYNPEECSCCGFVTNELSYYEQKDGDVLVTGWLCNVCSETLAGNSYFWPKNYSNPDVMKQISYCTNLILETIKNK